MTGEQIKEILGQQLQLLAERSKQSESVAELCELTNAMALLLSTPWPLA